MSAALGLKYLGQWNAALWNQFSLKGIKCGKQKIRMLLKSKDKSKILQIPTQDASSGDVISFLLFFPPLQSPLIKEEITCPWANEFNSWCREQVKNKHPDHANPDFYFNLFDHIALFAVCNKFSKVETNGLV